MPQRSVHDDPAVLGVSRSFLTTLLPNKDDIQYGCKHQFSEMRILNLVEISVAFLLIFFTTFCAQRSDWLIDLFFS